MENIRIGHNFRNPRLLVAAFTHPSHRHENGGEADNQRLEFLGDAVIGCVAAQVLYERFPGAGEGEISKKKSAVVSGKNLAGYARRLSLGEFMLLGRGEEKNDARNRDSTLADVFEAVVGAVFLDGGYGAAYGFVSPLILENSEEWREPADYKSELQEVFYKKFASSPVYKTEETGPKHETYFFCEVGNGSRILGRGQGSSKKEAEQRAAREALESLL